jgi:hypothetical protein
MQNKTERGKMEKQRKITLNAEKRKVIADQFQSFYENKVKDKLVQAKEQYDIIRDKAKVAIEKVVRYHQPQEDVDTIRKMISKYSSAGGDLYEDNCFYIQSPITKVDEDGKEYTDNQEINVRFDMGRNFARSYYRDEMKAKGLNPDFKLSIDNDYSKRNPKYYNDESNCNKFLGWNTSSNDDKSVITPKAKWENDFKLWVIGSSYCHSRQFKVDQNTLEFFKMYKQSAENVIKEHEQMYSYVEGKMKTLRLGLKSYRTYDQAKALADKVGVVLNESMLNESSSLALSIYSPENLASLLEDKEVLTREQKIAFARKQMQNQAIN